MATSRHALVFVDTRQDLFRSGPARVYAFCTKDGCRCYWNGIGSSFAWERETHEKLNEVAS